MLSPFQHHRNQRRYNGRLYARLRLPMPLLHHQFPTHLHYKTPLLLTAQQPPSEVLPLSSLYYGCFNKQALRIIRR